MSLSKEIVEQESRRQAADRGEVHLYKEGTFLRAYDWSAWLCCHYLHDFKVNKRLFKGIDEPVAYIGFPETSLPKWLPLPRSICASRALELHASFPTFIPAIPLLDWRGFSKYLVIFLAVIELLPIFATRTK